MFVGHIAIGLASKRWAPRTSLGALVAAPLLVDLLWPLFLLVGLEEVRVAHGDTEFTPLEFVSYPLSHSLVSALVLALAVRWGYRRFRADARGARVLAFGVLSHWFLDVLTHRPDMPLVPGLDLKVGLGLWNHVPILLLVEGGMFCAGLAIYAASTRPRGLAGAAAFSVFALGLLALWLAAGLGPPPQAERAVVWAALSLWLLPPLAAWLDRGRILTGEAQRAATRL